MLELAAFQSPHRNLCDTLALADLFCDQITQLLFCQLFAFILSYQLFAIDYKLANIASLDGDGWLKKQLLSLRRTSPFQEYGM